MLKPFDFQYLDQIEAINNRTYRSRWQSFDEGKVYVGRKVQGFSLINTGSTIMVLRIMVDRLYRGRGIGTLLLNSILLKKRPLEIVVNERDEHGIAWLRKKLFFGVGVAKDHYPDGDGWIFRHV